MKLIINKLFLTAVLIFIVTGNGFSQPGNYFRIQIVDEQTGRGVPLVELKTTNHLSYYTDNNGIIAFFEPGLMSQEVYFHIKSHGYEYPGDGFGYHGKSLKILPGDSALIKIKRVNIAERLYRVTGEGLYNDSHLAGLPVPLKQPLLNGIVFGQDTFIETLYKGKIYWFWGDTDQPSYPLGNFATSGATSELPAKGGLDPKIGIDLTYFVDKSGFSKKMCPVPGPGPVWIHWLATLNDSSGTQKLVGSYTRIKTLGEAYERGLAVFNDSEEIFKPFVQFELNSPFFPEGQSYKTIVNGNEYINFDFGTPFPLRVRADWEHVKNLSTYEAYSCLKEGSRYDTASIDLDRTNDGKLIYTWKTNTEPLNAEREKFLLKNGKLKPGETWFNFCDVQTGDHILSKTGSVFWNEYRRKWVMVFQQVFGTSILGEVWFAEGDTPTGPWVYARKIVTHDNYSFYNVGQHPLFDQDNGRLIFFEGTYTNSFTHNPVPTPRYNYNQVMYRLDLNDSRLFMPSPVYRTADKKRESRYMMSDKIGVMNYGSRIREIPFFALPPDRRNEGTIPVFEERHKGKGRLQTTPPNDRAEPLFYGLPGDASTEMSDYSKGVITGKQTIPIHQQVSLPFIVALYEYKNQEGYYSYSVESEVEGLQRSEKPVCRVWKNPSSLLTLDFEAKPVPIIK